MGVRGADGGDALAGALPAGDGHPVIVFPGLGASDISTAPLRSFLRDRGYTAYPWKQGFNFGPRDGVLEACRHAAAPHLAERHGEPVSLIGWSLGGIYARETGQGACPSWCAASITLGTPFTGHPRATNAWRFYEMVSGQHVHDEAMLAERCAAAAGADHVDLQQDRRRRRLAVQHQRRARRTPRTSRSTPATSAWA